jgi:hypothetical protein
LCRPNSEKRDTNNPEIIKSLDIRSLGAAAAFTQIQARSRLRKARGKIQNVMAVTAAPCWFWQISPRQWEGFGPEDDQR